MPIHNPHHDMPPPSGEKGKFEHQEIIQYADGGMALGFRTPGDTLDLGPGSIHKYARNFRVHGPDMAIINTRSGNVYGVALGLVVNKDRKISHALPDDTIKVEIGEPCVIPGVGQTHNVDSVLLRYKSAMPGSPMAEHQEQGPSPFVGLERLAEAINASPPPRPA